MNDVDLQDHLKLEKIVDFIDGAINDIDLMQHAEELRSEDGMRQLRHRAYRLAELVTWWLVTETERKGG